MKKILLLGDSIRMNYAPYVYRKLSDRAEIVTPEENCRFAKYTLHELPGWLKQFGKPDIVHWNNGLWDAHHFDGVVALTPVEDYVKDLERILLLLQQTGAKIVFATCTPARPENPEWDNQEIRSYNEAAVKLMEQYGIRVNHLYPTVDGHEAEFISDDLIHLTREGIQKVGQQVVDVLTTLL
ncbi:MAG: SGNH/GDSL hydrolase family protein [Clostridia bacterium]|nr:SGNH/GDSL hydrolase family protein [Clostridia bacterium]